MEIAVRMEAIEKDGRETTIMLGMDDLSCRRFSSLTNRLQAAFVWSHGTPRLKRRKP